MPAKKKLPEGVITLDTLILSDIINNEVTNIYITELPNDDGKLELTESWEQLIKAVLHLVYLIYEKNFMSKLYDANIIDKDFDISIQGYSMMRNGNQVYSELIPGTPYYINYDNTNKSMFLKVKQIVELKFKLKDVLITLKLH